MMIANKFGTTLEAARPTAEENSSETVAAPPIIRGSTLIQQTLNSSKKSYNFGRATTVVTKFSSSICNTNISGNDGSSSKSYNIGSAGTKTSSETCSSIYNISNNKKHKPNHQGDGHGGDLLPQSKYTQSLDLNLAKILESEIPHDESQVIR